MQHAHRLFARPVPRKKALSMPGPVRALKTDERPFPSLVSDETPSMPLPMPTNNENVDYLDALHARFRNKAFELHQELEAWETAKLRLLAHGAMTEDENEMPGRLRTVEKIQRTLVKAKGFFQSPQHYLRDRFLCVAPSITKLSMQVDGLLTQLGPSAQQSKKETLRLRLEICQTNIGILNRLQATFNEVNREINYCLKLATLMETVLTTLFQYTLGLKYHLPALDFGIVRHYRMNLYNSAHSEMERIYNFAATMQGKIEHSKKVLNQPLPKQANHFFKTTKTHEISRGFHPIASAPSKHIHAGLPMTALAKRGRQ